MSSRRDRRRRTVIFLSVGLAMSAFGVLVYALGVLNGLERQTIDSRFSIRGERHPPANIVFVAIDPDTLTRLNEHWPIRRRWHARLIHLLEKGGAKTIGYDVTFADPSDAVDDNQLYDAVSEAGNVVLAADEVRGNGQTRIFGGNANVRAAHARVANVQLPIDSDGIWRRMTYETL